MIAIVGDPMIDIDIHLERVKVMDGMPVFRETSRTERPGGASNVAKMCQALGRKIATFRGGVSTKTRHFSEGAIIHRIDNDCSEVSTEGTAQYWQQIISDNRPDIIVVCDHGKGTVTKPVMDMLKSTGIPIYVDPCVKSDWSLFAGVECISANREEWAVAPSGIDLSSSLHIRRADENGVFWNGNHLESICEYPVDTVGAGDQFIAVLACLRDSGKPWDYAIEMANVAAGMQCSRQGIVPVTWNEVNSFLIDEKQKT